MVVLIDHAFAVKSYHNPELDVMSLVFVVKSYHNPELDGMSLVGLIGN